MCDTMDSFTERMLKRVEERRKVLDQRLAAANHNNKNSNDDGTRNDSFDCNPGEYVDAQSTARVVDKCRDGSNKRMDCLSNEKENEMPQVALRSEAKKKLRKLGVLYSDNVDNAVISSPVQQTEQSFSAESPSPTRSNKQSAGLTRRLAALAETINQREDDLRHIAMKPPTPTKPAVVNRPWRGGIRQGASTSIMTFSKPAVVSVSKKINEKDKVAADLKVESPSKLDNKLTPTKSILLDKSTLEKLEAQGFARCESHSNLAFDYNKENKRSVRDRSPVKDLVENYNKENKRSVRDRSPVKDLVDNYNKIDAKAAKELSVISPLKNEGDVKVTNAQVVNETTPTSKLSESEKSKRRYGSPLQMGVGKPVLNVEGTSNVSTVMPAMGVRQLLSPHSSTNHGSVLQKAALFENCANGPTKKIQKDPAELPLSERKALFEKNAGTAILPKAPFALPVPPSMLQDKKQPLMLSSSGSKISQDKICPNKKPTLDHDKDVRKGLDSVVAKFERSADEMTTTQQKVKKDIEDRWKELDVIKNRWNQNKNISETTAIPSAPPFPSIAPGTIHQRTVTFSDETIINRFSYTTDETLSTENEQEEETFQQPHSPDREYPGVKDVKKIKVSPPKPGHLYPNLSDLETESDIPQSDFDEYIDGDVTDERNKFESSSDRSSMSEDSFGREIMRAAHKSLSESTLTTLKRDLLMSSSTSSDMSEESMMGSDMNQFLDEALADSDSEPTPPKRIRSSDSYDQNLSSSYSESFEYSHGNKTRTSSSHLLPRIVDGESELPLTYSVSFYRKQTTNREPLSPKRQVFHHSYREEGDESSDEDICRQQEAVEEKIAILQQEVSRQQTIISQTSQALNLCSSTIEFSGSTEEVEGEKLLLIATQKRQAALHEMQRLRVEGTLRPMGRDNSKLTEKGDLTLSNITLPLKLDNIRAAAREEKCYYLLCLIKSGDQVVSTVMKEALPRNLGNNKLMLPSTTPLTLKGLYSDFKVTIEVYGMSSRSKEVLPHDVKYHITSSKKDTCRLKLTPKKHKHDDKLFRPNLQSPGGPSAVRSPKFSLMGYVVFSLREINRRHFTLNKVPYTSVLEGSIELEINCQMTVDIEHRGFLTMFEDIGGTGAWHRRWCLLKGDKLSYWKYPDDEHKKIPMDTIDLSTCINEEVEVASRDICARPNSFFLETSRLSRPEDEPSLICIRRGDLTIIKHLLSADTKDDRIKWCDKLNKALALLRAWAKK